MRFILLATTPQEKIKKASKKIISLNVIGIDFLDTPVKEPVPWRSLTKLKELHVEKSSINLDDIECDTVVFTGSTISLSKPISQKIRVLTFNNCKIDITDKICWQSTRLESLTMCNSIIDGIADKSYSQSFPSLTKFVFKDSVCHVNGVERIYFDNVTSLDILLFRKLKTVYIKRKLTDTFDRDKHSTDTGANSWSCTIHPYVSTIPLRDRYQRSVQHRYYYKDYVIHKIHKRNEWFNRVNYNCDCLNVLINQNSPHVKVNVPTHIFHMTLAFNLVRKDDPKRDMFICTSLNSIDTIIPIPYSQRLHVIMDDVIKRDERYYFEGGEYSYQNDIEHFNAANNSLLSERQFFLADSSQKGMLQMIQLMLETHKHFDINIVNNSLMVSYFPHRIEGPEGDMHGKITIMYREMGKHLALFCQRARCDYRLTEIMCDQRLHPVFFLTNYEFMHIVYLYMTSHRLDPEKIFIRYLKELIFPDEETDTSDPANMCIFANLTSTHPEYVWYALLQPIVSDRTFIACNPEIKLTNPIFSRLKALLICLWTIGVFIPPELLIYIGQSF
jgi:hypothetical protein